MAATASGPTMLNIVSSWLSGKTFKAMLATSTYVFNKQTHDFRADVTNEVSGTGYTAGGVALTGVAAQQDTTNSRIEIVANDADFGTLTATGIAQIIVYENTGNAATDKILSVHTFTAENPSGANFKYAWNDDDSNTGTPGVIGYISY